MKKLILPMILCLLLGSVLSLEAVGASRGKLSVSGEVTGLKRGEKVELTVTLGQNPGVKNLRCTLGFDPKVLEFVSAEGTRTLSNFSYEDSEGQVLLRWQSETDTTSTGEVAKVIVRVKKDALYGDSAVTLTMSEILYDAQNGMGEAVPFDTTGLKFTLFCPHENPTVTVEKEATFAEEGILKETCPICGNVAVSSILPTVENPDGAVKITFPTDEFLPEDQVEVSIDYLFATKEEQEARALLSGNVLRVFRITVTKNGEVYVPVKDCTVTLRYDTVLPEGALLYGLMDGGAFQPETAREENILTFSYHESVFALVVRDAETEPEVPVTTTKKITTLPPNTADPVEEARKKEIFLIGAGVAALIICGAGMIFLLGRRKRF